METRVVADEDEEADFVEHLFAATSHDYLMFFTNTGRVYIERVFQIPEGSRIAKGRSIKNLLNLKPEESIASVLRIVAVGNEDKDATFVEDQFVLFATRSGKVKKTKLSDFRNFRKDGIIAIKIEEGNELIDVKMTNGADDISLVTSKGYAVRTSEENIRSMGRPSAGVAGIRPGEGDYLVSLAVVDNSEQLLVVSEKGLGKRTPFEDYPTKGRGGKGVITMKVTEKTGLVVKALRVSEDDEIMLMTDAGQSVRISAASARLTGRNAQGVILMKTKDGETIQDIARVVSDDVEDEEGEDASDVDFPDVENSEVDTASEE
jgi:DNA gyrase subunit A